MALEPFSDPLDTHEEGDYSHVIGKAQPARMWGDAPCSPALSFEETDAALVLAVRGGADAQALGRLFDRYGAHVHRVLIRTLGPDAELPDLVHDVFVEAVQNVGSLKDPDKLKSWLASIAVFTARGCIRRRQRWRWLNREPHRVPDWGVPIASNSAPAEISEALRCTYEVLSRFPVDERLAFALRFVDGMKLEDVAETCKVSLATIKRRLSRADKRFRALSAAHPSLQEWIDRGTRWGQDKAT